MLKGILCDKALKDLRLDDRDNIIIIIARYAHQWGCRANFSIRWQNSYLGEMGQSGARPIGNLFWDVGLIASYLLYWSLVFYPVTKDELRVRKNVYAVLGIPVLPIGRYSTSTRCMYCIVQHATVEVAVGSS